MSDNHDVERDACAIGGAFVGGILIGAVLGGLTALLLTPRSGKELRGQLSDSARELKGKAQKSYEQAAGKATEMAEKGRHARERALKVVEKIREEVKPREKGESAPAEAPVQTGTS